MNIPTREIPQERWLSFFDLVSDQYEGWAVMVEVLVPSAGTTVGLATTVEFDALTLRPTTWKLKLVIPVAVAEAQEPHGLPRLPHAGEATAQASRVPPSNVVPTRYQ